MLDDHHLHLVPAYTHPIDVLPLLYLLIMAPIAMTAMITKLIMVTGLGLVVMTFALAMILFGILSMR